MLNIQISSVLIVEFLLHCASVKSANPVCKRLCISNRAQTVYHALGDTLLILLMGCAVPCSRGQYQFHRLKSG